ncbi:MAG: DUF1622 domain-containing protein [Clostridia bacterium]|nr:DUF1622 domain-containing protein [Clostridia bacterium]
MHIIQQIESVFRVIVEGGILLLNTTGVLVLLVTALRCVIEMFQKNSLKRHVRIRLAEGTALALSFKLCAEVLRTVIVEEWPELAILGAVIVLRAALSFLLAWEMKNERRYLALVADEDTQAGAAEAGAAPATGDGA